jgi:uncharacterized protein YyaL (SSP411 family)
MRAPLFALLLGLVACLSSLAADGALVNRMRGHPSPYLAMHADDPVAWQDLNAAVLERARREGRLVLLSIGYFTCHWCHVMQRESFRNREIAALLNRYFIPVKVDRELEPALDARMMEFAESSRGQGGWPLNVFLTPQGYPLFAALYAPPAEFKEILTRLNELWTKDRAALMRLAAAEAGGGKGPGKAKIDGAEARRYANALLDAVAANADDINGGFGDQSKFPSVPQLEFLLARHVARPDAKLAAFLDLTLGNMASLGLHDELGGGFFRYSVDPTWKTPHFEKMLCDNALLARLYLRSARVLKQPRYEQIAAETLEFMERELKHPDGGYIAALSAVDDQNIEGGYYLWSDAELRKLLSPDELKIARSAWGMTDAAPFDAGHLPMHAREAAEVARQVGKTPAALREQLASAASKLRAARAQRALPRDTKVLAGWNGLALTALVEAAQITGDPRYRQRAEALHGVLATHFWDGKSLRRAVSAGLPAGSVALEDYAYVGEALVAFGALSGREVDFALARHVIDDGWRRFYGKQGWRLSESALVAGRAGDDAVVDGPLPSPSATLIAATLELAERSSDNALRQRALGALNSGHAQLAADPFWHATHIAVMLDAQ